MASGAARKYLLASLDQSLQADGARLCRHLLFAPLRSRHAAGGDDGRARSRPCAQGKALYVGISSYNRRSARREAAAILRRPRHALPHPPAELLDAQPLGRGGRPARHAGGARASAASCFSPLAQGMLTDKYLGGIPDDSRAASGRSLRPAFLSDDNLAAIRGARTPSPGGAARRWPQMALAWVLRGPARHLGADRRQPAGAGRGLRRRAEERRLHAPRNWPRSTATPRTPASTCGAGRGRRERGAGRWPARRGGHCWGSSRGCHDSVPGRGTAGERPRRGPPRGHDARREARPAHHGDGAGSPHRAGAGPRLTSAAVRARRASAASSTSGGREPIRARAAAGAVEETRLGIPLFFGLDVLHGHRTDLPDPARRGRRLRPRALGADRAAAAEEAAADGLDAHLRADARRRARPALGPHRRGAGRGPVVGPRFAAAKVRGFQGDDLAAASLAATAKHLARYGAVDGRPRLRGGRRLRAHACARSICRRSAPRSRPASRPSCRPSPTLAGVPMTARRRRC